MAKQLSVRSKRKSLFLFTLAEYEKKRKLKEALREGKAIPTEIAAIAHDLEGELNMEDANTFKRPSLLDDEYAKAGKVLLPLIFVHRFLLCRKIPRS